MGIENYFNQAGLGVPAWLAWIHFMLGKSGQENYYMGINSFKDVIMDNIILITLTLAILLLSVSLGARSGKETQPVKTVDQVALDRYLGVWYQQSFFPFRFQKADCGQLTTAEYSLDSKGRINVLNTCYADAEGKVVRKQAKAKAWAVDPSNAKLKVQFFWPFKADYWVVKLDKENYSYAVVSESTREYLWILTREKTFDKATYDGIISWLKDNGWDTDRLVFTGNLK
jgi:apolipoprotein D and lipocalin family protein